MNSATLIRVLSKQQKITQGEMAEKFGYNSRQNFNMKLRQKNFPVDRLVQCTRILGYKIVAVPDDMAMPEGCFTVTED